MYDTNWDGHSSFGQRVLDAVGSRLLGKTSVQSGVDLGVGRLSWVREAIQEVSRHNCPSFLRNQLFPKSVYTLLRVVGMLDPMSIYLQDFNLKEE